MKTKLLIVTDYFYPHWTGISKSIHSLIRDLHDEFDITVLTVRFEKNLKKEDIIFSSKIIREDYLFTLSRSKYSLSLLWKFFQLASENDVVLINSPSSNVLPVAILAKLVGKKLLIFNQAELILPKGFINKIIEKVFEFSTISAFALANKIASYSKDYAEDSKVVKPFLSKFHPLLMPIFFEKGVDTTKLKPLKKLKEEEKLLFGFVGRFVEEKGFDILFHAIPHIVAKIPQAHFVFAGELEVSYENFFQNNLSAFKKIEEHVTLLGLLNDSEIVQYYDSLDFLVVPSRYDCFNLAQAEAMLRGVPVVVANVPGARYLVQETGFGLLFESRNPNSLAEKVLDIVRRKKEIATHHEDVKALLDNKKNINKIKKFISS